MRRIFPDLSARQGVRPIAAALVATLAVACGKDASHEQAADAGSAPTPAAPGATRNACQVLPAAEVQTVIGEPARDSLALALPDREAPTVSQCNYATARNPAAVSFLLRRSAPGEGVDAAAHATRQTLTDSGVRPEDVPGLGTVAIWGGNQLHVLIDAGWHLVLTPIPSAGLVQARAMAERALANLTGG